MNEREKIIRLWFDMWLKQQEKLRKKKKLLPTSSSFPKTISLEIVLYL